MLNFWQAATQAVKDHEDDTMKMLEMKQIASYFHFLLSIDNHYVHMWTAAFGNARIRDELSALVNTSTHFQS